MSENSTWARESILLSINASDLESSMNVQIGKEKPVPNTEKCLAAT
jgi:hypothetical protein